MRSGRLTGRGRVGDKPGDVNVRRENLRLVADDAAAAMDTLRKEQTLRLVPRDS